MPTIKDLIEKITDHFDLDEKIQALTIGLVTDRKNSPRTDEDAMIAFTGDERDVQALLLMLTMAAKARYQDSPKEEAN